MPIEKQTWHLLKSKPESPAFNMAMDEALLDFVSQINSPILRFYAWSEPAASFGYFQRYSEIERVTLLRPLVRRPTGGGVVPHDSDWTYSVVFPPPHAWYSLTAKESYLRVHQWIQASFARLNVTTELANCCRREHPGQCFKGYELHDVLWHQQKIAGAAQRRSRTGLLIQGSVQPPPIQLSCDAWHQAMCEVSVQPDVEWTNLNPPPALLERAQLLTSQKYSQTGYTQKR